MSIEKLRPTFTFTEDRLRELQSIVPEAFADGKINWDTLREALGEYLDEEGQEHFGLSWPGKREARRLANFPSKGALVPLPSQGVNEKNTHNLFIEGDNLEVLKLLQKSYAGRIKMIYIDPPYNTGNDFVYPDDYSEPLAAYLQRTGQTDESGKTLTTNSKVSGRFHSNWLNMMYSRLLLAKQLLREDGVIFISIDDNEIHHLRLILNEIFGEENFIGQIVVQSNPRGSQSIKHLANVHEYIIVFAKNIDELDMLGIELSDAMKDEYKYTYKDGRKYRLQGLRQRGSSWRREDRPSLFFSIWVNPDTGATSLKETKDFSIPVYPIKPTTGEDGRWRWSTSKVIENNELVVGQKVERSGEPNAWDIFQIDFLQATDGDEKITKAKSIWLEKELNYQNGRTELKALFKGVDVFDFPKPVTLIKKLLEMIGVNDDCIVLDFFAGSCTTAHAVLGKSYEDGINRQFIMVQLPEPTNRKDYPTIAEIGKERIRRVIHKMETEGEGRLNLTNNGSVLGFKVFCLDRSQFKEWQPYVENNSNQLSSLFDQFETPLTIGWKPQSLLTEVILLQGFPLDSTIHPLTAFHENSVQEVTHDFCGHRLYVCLDEKISETTVDAISIRPEDIFVCLDSAMSDEDKIRLSDRCNLKVI